MPNIKKTLSNKRLPRNEFLSVQVLLDFVIAYLENFSSIRGVEIPTLPDFSQLGFGTRAVHVGQEPDAGSNAVIPSISMSTTFKQFEPGVHKV